MRFRVPLAFLLATAVGSFGAVQFVQPAQAGSVTATVIKWIDGDTVETTEGRIRLIGVNAPERKTCGYGKAKKLAKRLAPHGSQVTLRNPSSVTDRDSYGRLLRYVGAGPKDVGMKLIKAGSQAKYDSTDGHDRHPKQKRYRKQDIKHRDYCANHDLKSYPPASSRACPKKARIKGNRGSGGWIYHLPGQQYYKVTGPEECFASDDGAKKHGYRAALT